MSRKETDPKIRSDEARFKKYYKTPKKESVFWIIATPIREYGVFAIPLLLAYILLYYVIFENGGKEDGLRAMYVIGAVALLAADIGSIFLRKLYRKHKFIKYSSLSVPIKIGNLWHCPHCKNENRGCVPCKYCGIYPTLYKETPKSAAGKSRKKDGVRSKKLQKQYDAYKPQFSMKSGDADTTNGEQ